MGSQIVKLVLGAGLIVLASSADAKPKAKPVPPPPPKPAPPPVVYIPPRPTPPLGAAPTTLVPPLGANGVRQTVNAGITPNQTVWNFRSAFNVAALNCLRPEHAEILVGYKLFLKNHRTGLARANTGVNTEFRKRYGAAYVRPREAYMTKVYNFYAFPPTVANFCDVALAVSLESKTVKPVNLTAFATRSLAALDKVFDTFFIGFEQYRVDAAAWDAKYAPTPAPAVIPAVVAVPAPTPTPTAKPTGK
ncbi:hypothetical protein [Novosphingobium sp.]|uniref:hypothetical protein n=1 Tax=Novosphingobium sp. TaxID=1874826 RepID=UPI00286C9467|nr:hypothetical protein [Novosphingobium sp.]